MGESKESWWKKIHFVCLLRKIKDNDKPEHWVGHSKLGSLEIDDFLKISPTLDEK